MTYNHRVAAIVCLHFGVDYLPYAMRSVADDVDAIFIMYSPVANHGVYNAALTCPETKDMLWDAAATMSEQFEVFRWFDYDKWHGEGEQFKAGYDLASDFDVIVKLDADEIYPPTLLADAIAYGLQQQVHEIRLPLRHYWRSFYKAFTGDPAAPGRIYLREFSSGEVTYTPTDERDRVHHFGYSLPIELMRYKWQTHGHGREFRRDINWFEDVYLANRQYDCHPVGSEYWMHPVDVVPPDFLLSHPFARLPVIE